MDYNQEIIRQLKIAAGRKVLKTSVSSMFQSPVDDIRDMCTIHQINEIIRKYENEEENLLTPEERKIVQSIVKII